MDSGGSGVEPDEWGAGRDCPGLSCGIVARGSGVGPSDVASSFTGEGGAPEPAVEGRVTGGGDELADGPGHMARGARGMTGRNLRKNFLLRKVTRPEPSTLTTYWSNWRTSTTIPVLSHLVGWGPVWFWIRTQSPMTKGGRTRVWAVRRSAVRMCRFRRASSLDRRVSCQVEWGWYFPGWMGMKSRMGRPKTHWAGERWVSRSGVLRYCSMAR